MKKIIFIFILINLALVFANSDNPPMLPDNIYGTANINLNPVPINTEIFAEINETVVGSITTIKLGNYGTETNIENRFLISGYTFDMGEKIIFYIEVDQNKIYAITEPEVVVFEGGSNKEVALNFNYEITNPPVTPPEEPPITPPSNPPSNSGGGSSSSGTINNTTGQTEPEIEENIDPESTEFNDVNQNINLNPPHSPADGNLTFLTEKSKNIDENININTVEKLKNNDSYLIYIIIGIITTIIIIITIKKIKE